MRRTGILFQGMPICGRDVISFLKGEMNAEEEKVWEKKKGYLDVTYFLIYALCQNVRCRGKVRDMRREWRDYLEQRAEASAYQGGYFWRTLGREEYRCAKIILGILEEIRSQKEEAAEKAWVVFWYLLHYGFREDFRFLEGKEEVAFEEICKNARTYQNWQFMGVSQICLVTLEAENRGILVLPDEKYWLWCRCAKEGTELWESGTEEAHNIFFQGDKEEKTENLKGTFEHSLIVKQCIKKCLRKMKPMEKGEVL